LTSVTQKVDVSHLSKAPDAGKPWFAVVSGWIELEGVTGVVVAEKAPKAGLYQLIET
jgi:hypothetical protein